MAAAAQLGQRPVQVTVWGASGFTGRLVCEHLVQNYQGKVRWAMAGRNKAKLEEVKQELSKIDPSIMESVPIVIADADDSTSLNSMAAGTDVIISTAGPFAKYGSKVVEAALEQGSHYCDITGELVWVRRMIRAHHEAAVNKGVKIVHCCGYDSIPFDLGVLLLADHACNKLNTGLSQAYGLAVDARGGFSGGTIASGLNQVEAEASSDVSQLMNDKYFLLPPDAKCGSDVPPGLLPEWNQYSQTWMAPFVMEPVNSRIVQRSNYLNGTYGTDFKYREAMSSSSLPAAGLMSAGLAGVGAVFALSPLRALAKKTLPQPGQGPSRDLMLNGYWKHKMIGVTEAAAGQQPQVIVADVADEWRDPGYWGAARMVLEAGLCLALDGKACADGGCASGGVLTPASAMGLVLIERLRKAGIRFDITSSPGLNQAVGQKQQQAVGVGSG